MSECATDRCQVEASQRTKRTLRWVTGVSFAALIAAGWIVPWVGYFVPLCMIGGLVPAFFLGRKWCDWTCWRGGFLESAVALVTGGRPVPRLLRSTGFRVGVMALLFTMFGFRITQLWGDWLALGGFFVMFLTATTVVAVLLGIIYEPRSWCAFCPLGTLGGWAGAGRKPLHITDACVGCGVCVKACPMDIDIPSYVEQGVVTHGDCIKCGACIAKCPVGALSFDDRRTRAA